MKQLNDVRDLVLLDDQNAGVDSEVHRSIIEFAIEEDCTFECIHNSDDFVFNGENLLMSSSELNRIDKSSEFNREDYFLNIKGMGCEDIISSLKAKIKNRDGENWKPWFPVIDYSRCTNCMQCLSFCLFDVYGVSEKGEIKVQNHQKCKTDCPACSRVCPEVAIMFPKYRSGPINGEEVKQEDIDREKMKVDISSLLGGNVHEMLRDRSERAKSRFGKERDEEKALKERVKCLKKFKDMMSDDLDSFMSLPSEKEIEERIEDEMKNRN